MTSVFFLQARQYVWKVCRIGKRDLGAMLRVSQEKGVFTESHTLFHRNLFSLYYRWVSSWRLCERPTEHHYTWSGIYILQASQNFQSPEPKLHIVLATTYYKWGPLKNIVNVKPKIKHKALQTIFFVKHIYLVNERFITRTSTVNKSLNIFKRRFKGWIANGKGWHRVWPYVKSDDCVSEKKKSYEWKSFLEMALQGAFSTDILFRRGRNLA